MGSTVLRRALALAGVALVLSTTAVFADNVLPDGDNSTPIAADPLALGTVCVNSTNPADSVTENVLLGISRNGNYSTAQVFKKSTTVTFSVESVSGTGLSAAVVGASFTVPSNWDTAANTTVAGQATSKVTFTAGSTAGPFAGSVVYKATGTQTDGTTLTRSATLNVTATVSDTGACAPTPPDATPPTVTVSFPDPVSGLNGWFNANDSLPVVGSVTASDVSNVAGISCTGASLSDASGYGTTSASATLTVSGDGTHNVSCTATDGAVPANTGAATGSVSTATIKIDATAPVITDDSHSPSAPDGSHSWYVSKVTETFKASDPTSGLADCAASFTKDSGTTEGSAVTINSGSCSDNAGNTNDGINSAAYKIDLTNPSVSITTPSDGLITIATGIVVTGTASDTPSGIDAVSVNGVATDNAAAWTTSPNVVPLTCGDNTVTALATDVAGRTSTASITVTRLCFTLQYLQPIDQSTTSPIVNTGKYGRVIPVKVFLGLQGGGSLSDADLAAFSPPLTLQMGVNSAVCSSGAASDTVEAYADAGQSSLGTNLFRWDPLAQQWIYNLDTKAPPGMTMTIGSCYRLDVYVSDGTNKVKVSNSPYALFKPTK